jgi:5'-nucleotidase
VTKVILTNDDGIDGAGLWALRDTAVNLGYDWAIVAPLTEQSGCGHQTTTTKPMTIVQKADNVYAIEGTPADCARVAITYLFPKVDLLLSGINHGGNLGVDVYTSGTVAAAREACFHGVPAVALSHYKLSDWSIDWQWASRTAARVLKELMPQLHQSAGAFWNVNLPHLFGTDHPPIINCPLSIDPLPCIYALQDQRLYYQGQYEKRPRSAGTDVAECFGGKVSVTKIFL